MSTSSPTFFAEERNSAVIRSFATTIKSVPPLEPPFPEVIKPLSIFFFALSQNLSKFDEYCQCNIEWIGGRFIGTIQTFLEERPQHPHESLFDIFTASYRFLCELEFSQPGELNSELRSIQEFVHLNLEKFPGADKQQLVFASFTMPASITKKLLHHTSLSDFKEFTSTADAAKAMKAEWDREISTKKAETEGLLDAINQLQTKFNFVGLVKGFETLLTQKKAEVRHTFYALLALGALMVAPVCTQIVFVLNNIETIESHRTTLVYSLPPLLALELILLYFFRVVLTAFRGIKAQLLQLDLRVSLCQFIQSYSEYSTRIKKDDPTALTRFESIVFSAITQTDDGLPQTFDGLEQISKLISSLRGK